MVTGAKQPKAVLKKYDLNSVQAYHNQSLLSFGLPVP
jgi:hypothetical protein